jgi:hypothetical protein
MMAAILSNPWESKGNVRYVNCHCTSRLPLSTLSKLDWWCSDFWMFYTKLTLPYPVQTFLEPSVTYVWHVTSYYYHGLLTVTHLPFVGWGYRQEASWPRWHPLNTNYRIHVIYDGRHPFKSLGLYRKCTLRIVQLHTYSAFSCTE